MRRGIRLVALVIACTVVSVHFLRAELTVAKVFGENMVLQRGKEIKIWGNGTPGDVVTVQFVGQTATCTVALDGKWDVLLPQMNAGGPYRMQIQGSESLIEFNNILVGDVWVCSGQSNMQWTIAQTQFKEVDTAFLQNNMVRMLNVAISWDCLPSEDISGGAWSELSVENIQFFSAVAYHFGKAFYKDQKVPIGLINSSLGATAIETWMSNDALMDFEQFQPDIQPVLDHGMSYAEMQEAFEEQRNEWESRHYLVGPGIDGEWHLPTTEISDWGTIHVPAYTDAYGLADHDGAVWYRKEFDLPQGFNGESFLMQLNQIRDYDKTWVNGVKVGETYGRHTHRNYQIDASILKPTGNTLVVRTFDVGGPGGFTTNAFWGNSVLLGEWKFKPGYSIEASEFPKVTMPDVSPFSSPGVLYNSNIAPLHDLQITGVIWYQGESNEYRAHEYRQLLPAMITDWRAKWGLGDFPFLIVQLANYKQPVLLPSESQWAELREAQSAALSLPNTGLACTIDIGEANDIHPKNKQDVGKRLALAAATLAYGEDVVYSGPVVQDVSFGDRAIAVTFENVGKGLRTREAGRLLGGFAIADDSRQFRWADAKIQSHRTVVISVPDGFKAIAVRYAWGDNPIEANLYNKEGLPALPFRTDDWPGLTYEVKYDYRDDRF